MNSETHFRLLRLIEANPEITQRELADQAGISLGKANYCLKALIDKGLVKAGNFSRSRHKHRYIYKLTPAGLAEKARITGRFLKRKIAEHEALTREIEQLRREVGEGSDNKVVE